MREHIYRLHGYYAILLVEVVQVACLCSRVATDVDDALGGSPQNGLHHIGMHAGTWRVSDNHIGLAVLSDELVGQYILHVAGIEQCVRDAVDFRVDLRILNGFRHVFDANHLAGTASHEVGNGACAGVEVVD